MDPLVTKLSVLLLLCPGRVLVRAERRSRALGSSRVRFALFRYRVKKQLHYHSSSFPLRQARGFCSLVRFWTFGASIQVELLTDPIPFRLGFLFSSSRSSSFLCFAVPLTDEMP